VINEIQKEKLRHFLTYPKMFVSDTEKWQIISFIHGFEFALDDNSITESISDFFQKTHNIFGSNSGWPYQVEQFADKNSIGWFESFKIVTEHVIN